MAVKDGLLVGLVGWFDGLSAVWSSGKLLVLEDWVKAC